MKTARCIETVEALEILDSRGNPTVEVAVGLQGGAVGRAAVPSGASTGEHEALELRDKDPKRYLGKGVTKAVKNVNGPIAKVVKGLDASDQPAVDHAMLKLDGTPTKSKLGANAILGRVDGCCQSGGGRRGVASVPVSWWGDGPPASRADDEHPQRRFSCGQQRRHPGIHDYADRREELFESPADGRRGFPQPEVGAEVERALHFRGRRGRFRSGRPVQRGSAGTDRDRYQESGLQGWQRHRLRSRRRLFGAVRRGEKTYKLAAEKNDKKAAAMVDWYDQLVSSYPIISVEDGLDENDWAGWKALTDKIGDKVQLVGDDLFVTNVDRLGRGIKEGIANSI